MNAPRDIQSEDVPAAEQQYDVKKTKTRTLLTNKKDAMRTSSRAGVRLEKIPESHLSVNKGNNTTHGKAYSVDPMERSLDFGSKLGETMAAASQTPLALKNQKISPME